VYAAQQVRVSLPVAWIPALCAVVSILADECQYGSGVDDVDVDYFQESSDALVLKLIHGVRGMIGVVLPYVGSAPPDGCLPCDGTSYLRVDWPELYQKLDPIFIIDGDEFFVPDLRARFLIGAGNGRVLGATGGEDTHTLTENEMPSHTHSEVTATPVLINGGLGAPAPAAEPGVGSTGSTGGGQPHNNMPPYYTIRFCIVAR
jgi:microcystin-dependent protein